MSVTPLSKLAILANEPVIKFLILGCRCSPGEISCHITVYDLIPVKKEVKANGLKGEIKIYLNAEQRAAYYTVDGQGSDDFKVDLTTLAE